MTNKSILRIDKNKSVQLMRCVRLYYEGSYYSNNIQARPISFHLRKLARKLKIKTNDKMLDVACGTGEWLKACSLYSSHLSGIDISKKAVDISKNKIPGAVIESGRAEELPFKNGSFDIITCLGALEHFIDQEMALKEMVRVAKPGARFLILVPNLDFWARKIGLFNGTGQVNCIEEVKSLGDWNNLFYEAGLKEQEKWSDLHFLSYDWISNKGKIQFPFRLFQGAFLALWPVKWQYQVYHLLVKK